MAGASAIHRYTFAEYLALEETSNVKHEFLGGEIYALAGGTPDHAALAANLIIALASHLGESCRVFSSDLRIRVRETGLAAYPDVTVICGPVESDPDSPSTAVNPVLVAEVTSDSTEEFDHGEKLDHYQRIQSLRECLLVSHRERKLTVWRREGDAWRREESSDRVHLDSLHCEVSVDAVYRGVDAGPRRP